MLTFPTRQESLIYGQVALIVSPTGEIDDRSVRQFEQQLQDYFNVGYRFLVLNCSGLQAINSTGLEIILKMIETYQEAGGIFLLIQVQALPQISKFFDMLGFSPIFTSFTSKEEALGYLSSQTKAAFEAEGGKDTKSLPGQTVSSQAGKPMSSPDGKVTPTASYMSPQPMPAIPVPTTVPAAPPAPATPPATPPISNVLSDSQKKSPKVERRTLTGGTDVSVQLQIRYYPRMSPLHVFPLTVTIQPSSKATTPQACNIVTYFPGCVVVPESKSVNLQDRQDATFWVTPLACQKIQGWLEFFRGEESVCTRTFACHLVKARMARLFFFLALVSIVVWLWSPAFLQNFQNLIGRLQAIVGQILPENIQQIVFGDNLALWVGGLFLLLAVACYWIRRPYKTTVNEEVVIPLRKSVV
jgi:anti-anti-sigma factor